MFSLYALLRRILPSSYCCVANITFLNYFVPSIPSLFWSSILTSFWHVSSILALANIVQYYLTIATRRFPFLALLYPPSFFLFFHLSTSYLLNTPTVLDIPLKPPCSNCILFYVAYYPCLTLVYLISHSSIISPSPFHIFFSLPFLHLPVIPIVTIF